MIQIISRSGSGRWRNFAAAIQCLLFLSACNSRGSNPSAASPSQPPAATTETMLSQSNVQVSVQPALTPNFQPSIHDYVVDCNSSSSVLFTAQIGNGMEVFVNDVRAAEPGQTARVTVPLAANQRFTFAFGGSNTALGYSVRCLPPGFPPISTSATTGSQAQWYLFSPSLGGTPGPYYVIVADANGTPVWWMEQAQDQSPIDADIIGTNRIAWTTGDGSFTLRSFDGIVQNVLGSGLDFHELQLTPAGTYLVIQDVYRECPPDCADMSPWGGSAQAAVLDAEIHEIDSRSNVLWTWRTRDHIALSESGTRSWFPQLGNDIIHMNAVEPDGEGALLFSARHLDAIYHITKSTGAIDWKLGGSARAESLTVIGDTRPTATGPAGQALSGQHDVRLLADRTITLHDNGTNANRSPFAMRYVIDEIARTAQVVEAVQDSRATYSACCGSARRLPGGNWVVQWGFNPYTTELDPSGNPVVTISYQLGPTFSYRAAPILPGVVSADQLRQGMDDMALRHGAAR
jgi:Arylsulfotransferase (ASST)